MRRCLPALRTTRATGCPKEERAAARAQVGESGVGTRCLDNDLRRQDVSGGSIPELPNCSSWWMSVDFWGLYIYIYVYNCIFIYIIEYSCWIILSPVLWHSSDKSCRLTWCRGVLGFPHLRSGGCLLLQPCQQLKVDWLPDRWNEAICVLDVLDVLAWPEERWDSSSGIWLPGLVNVNKKLWKTTIINGKIHYFYGNFQ